jgi:hypothetical protein
LGILTIACGDGEMVGPEQPAIEASLVSTAGFLRCAPLGGVTSRKVITPGVWDTLLVGPHRLIFQPGSLRSTTLITATGSADSTRSVTFGPEGLKFQAGRAPRLQLSVQGCTSLTTRMSIVYTDDNLLVLKEQKPSVVDLFAKTVSANISHFSRYAVHY